MTDPMHPNYGTQWEQLFGVPIDGRPVVRFSWFVLRKHGHAFLFLPSDRRFACQALMLYPAQTPFARAARALLRQVVRLHLPMPTIERASWIASAENEFVKFMAELVGLAPSALPTPAVLAGNPAGPGPRYMLLLSDSDGLPKIVVKAGISPAAKELIRAESNILSRLPAGLAGTPRILANFKSAQVEAFALQYFAGDSPRTNDPHILGALLERWINTNQTVRIADVPAWQRLARACAEHDIFKWLAGVLADRVVHPVVWHGDFVPWNIKVNPKDGRWTVLDWERAEQVGMPTWDWFHYVIQTEILVNKRSGIDLFRAVESLLGTEPFRAYAARARITGLERSLLLAYLLYNNQIIHPAEGLDHAIELLKLIKLAGGAGAKK